MKIVTAILARGGGEEIKHRDPPPLADEVAVSMAEAVTEICALLPVSQAHVEQKAFSS